ncbi:MAG: hypothetical protein JOS17DRAFT_804203 [Linnemannia elongata]|nr:MAG: hypothetical protein JOS17DRAFT_804203 [Linnemannia elongata]
MKWQHPLVCLKIGTLSANTKRALGDGIVQQQAVNCVKDITNQALTTKRDAQEFLGCYIEAVFSAGLTDEDRSIFASMCPEVTSTIKVKDRVKDEKGGEGEEIKEDEEDEEDEEDDDDKGKKTDKDANFKHFYAILLAHLYSRKRLPTTVVGRQVQKLISRAHELQVSLPVRRQWSTVYTIEHLLSSVKQQLYVEIKKMYITGTKDLEKKDPRRITLLSTIQTRFVDFGERQLVALFWKWNLLRAKLVDLLKADKFFEDSTINPSQIDTMDWSATKPPGFILTQFLTDVGRAVTATVGDKRNRGYRKSTRMMDTAEMISHLQDIDHPDFDATLYTRHGYILKGSIRSNGHLIQVSAFKLQNFRRYATDV